MNTIDDRYYVYAHYKADSGEIFYIGKGSENRALQKGMKDRSDFWHRVVNKHGFFHKILHDNLTEEQAFEIERAEIAKHGRIKTGTGTLINLSDGGEGSSGHRWTEEQREAQSKRQIGRPGPVHTEETRRILSEKKKGHSHSSESRVKMSESRKGKKRIFTEAHRRALSESKRNRQRTDKEIEAAKLDSERKTGKKLSPEHCAAISAGKLAASNRKKNSNTL